MAHEQHPELSRQIWDKDVRAIERARAIYDEDPVRNLVMWASTLYSFKEIKEYADELKELKPRLIDEVPGTVSELARAGKRPQAASVAETVATHLAWMSAEEQDPYPHKVRKAAESLIGHALRLTVKEPLGEHTRALAHLVAARLAGPDSSTFVHHLDEARYRTPYIKDLDQRIRAYRNLAFWYWRDRDLESCGWWGVRWLWLRLMTKLGHPPAPVDVPKEK